LIAQQEKMGIPSVLNEVIKAHGNRQGLSTGWLTTAWLGYMLSQSDHRMSYVEDWAEKQIETLQKLVPEAMRVKDMTDDRLAKVLDELSDDAQWEKIEQQLGRHLIRVYDLSREAVRVDSTSVPVHHSAEEGGLFRYGYSKDRRPDLAQFKVMLSTLDPLGMPLATLVEAGNEADDVLYIPAIERSQAVVGKGQQLYIGDSKMSALDIRAFIATSEDYYLTPLPRRQAGADRLENWLKTALDGSQRLNKVYIPSEKGKAKLWMMGYEVSREQSGSESDEACAWQERVLVLYSPALAKRQRYYLEQRLRRAERELGKLVPAYAQREPKWETVAQLEAAAQLVLERYRVDGLLQVQCSREVSTRHIRKYKERPQFAETRIRDRVTVRRNREAIRLARRRLGWRMYVTNAPQEKLPFDRAVLVYRNASRIEQDFRRLKGRPLGLRPVYVQRDDRAIGMTRLLSLALRVLALVEFVVRESLQQRGEQLAGLYPGQPTRLTARPTTERLLMAFEGIHLSLVRLNDGFVRHITPLTALQQRILDLLGLPASVYEQLATLDIPSIPP